MNRFKEYKNFEDKAVNYKIVLGDDGLFIELILSCDENIWQDSKLRINKYHKDIVLGRDEWAKIKGYEDYSDVVRDFNEAIAEFESDKHWSAYSSEINQYLFKKV